MGCDFLKKDFCKKDFFSDTMRSLPLTLWEAALREGWGIPSCTYGMQVKPTLQIALNKY